MHPHERLPVSLGVNLVCGLLVFFISLVIISVLVLVLVNLIIVLSFIPVRCRSSMRSDGPLVTELLQLPVPGCGTVYRHISEMLTYRTVGSNGH